MSLLLDALKKAADEKKKDSEAVQIDESNEPGDNRIQDQSVDLDLELSLKEEQDFPEVHEEIVKTIEKPESINDIDIPPLEQPEVELGLESVAVQQTGVAEPDQQPSNVPDEESESHDEKIVITEQEESRSHISEHVSTENYQLQQETKDKQSSVEDQSVHQKQQREQVQASEHRHQQDRDALSALINKNTAYRNKRGRIINLSILTSLFLILLGASFYAYFMLDTVQSKHQKTSLADVPKAPIPIVQTASRDKVAVIETGIEKSAVEPRIVQPSKAIVESKNKSKTVAPVTKKSIQIKKRIREDPIGLLLTQAYSAFKQPEYARSQTLYNQVIKRDQNNRDALLGLAAIAVKQGRFQEAQQFYKRLLILDPKDSFAKAGLSALMNQSYAQLNESQIKVMLREQPGAGHLYFALGNLYLNQRRFAEAQSAFFNAWTNQKSNTDYAYNLAVSLDHLGKPEHAVNYYRLSLQLYAESGGNLLLDDVKQRIRLIEGQTK